MKNKDWGRAGGGGGLINFPPLKRGDLIEDLRYSLLIINIPWAENTPRCFMLQK